MSETVRATRPDAVDDRAAFAAALTRLREDADLSVRDVARLTGLRASTLGGWFGGHHLPQRSQRAALLAVLEACGVGGSGLEAWVAAVERVRGAPPPATRPPVAPYRGLLSYEASDADWFFGREAVTATLLDRVGAVAAGPGPRVLVVVAASGSGKSSVLRAGLLPAVERDGVPGSARRWRGTLLTPGTDPRAALTEALAAADRAAHPADDPAAATLLVVDQAEELFATAVPEPDRLAFLDDLLARAASTASPTVVVLGLRADFYGAAVGYPALARALQDHQVVLPPMGEDDVRRAIVEPARRADVTVDPALVERLLRDLGTTRSGAGRDPGALPLLSHALRVTWERSSGRRLTVADYDATGGITGSIEQTAEEVHTGLDATGRDLTRRLFLRLVRVDDTTGVVTRRPLTRASLPAAGVAATTAVLDAFVARRLLTTQADTVEISHERLLTAWPRIGEWIEADRDVLRARHQLADAVQAWQASGRDPAFLLTGTRLAAATELVDADAGGVAAAELDLVTASVDAVEADRRRQRRRLRRTRQLLALVAVLALAAGAAGIVALRAGRSADAARERAEAAGRASLSRQVAIEARELEGQDPALAQQLAVVAWRTSPTTEARSELVDQSAGPVVTRMLGAAGPTPLAVSADGRRLALGHADDGSVHLYSLRGGVPAAAGVIPGVAGEQPYALRWSGSLLAVGGKKGVVGLWDVGSGGPVRRATLDHAFGTPVQAVAFSPDGRSLAAVGAGDDPVRVWDVSAPAAPRFVAAPAGVPAGVGEQTVTFSPAGDQLVAAGAEGRLFVWPTADLTAAAPRVLQAAVSIVNTVVYGPTGRSLYVGNRLGTIEVRDSGTFAVTATHQLSTTGWVNVLAFSPDGTEVAAGNSDGVTERFGVEPWSSRRTTGSPGPVTGLAYTPDGRSLISAAADGTTRITPVAGPVTVGPDLSVFSLTYSASGDTLAVATSGSGATAQLWDTSDPARPRPLGPGLAVPRLSGTSALRPDGGLLAAGSADGSVRLWDTRDPTSPVAVGDSFAAAGALVEWVGFSPDGRVLAVGADDDALHLFDVADPAAPTRLAVVPVGGQALGAGFSPDGRTVAVASGDGRAHLVDVADVRHPRETATLAGFGSYVYGVAFSPDGRWLAATSADQTTRIWDVHRRDRPPVPVARLTGPRGYDIAVAWSPDSRQLAVASNDKTVWLYDVSDPTAAALSATLRDVGGNVNAVAFSPDGVHLVGGGRSPTVPVWTTDADAVAAQICAAAGDRITAAEWAQYVPGAAYDPPCG